MTNKKSQQRPGLRDVIAGETKICLLDETRQDFYYRGYSIKELAQKATFEDVIYILLFDDDPLEERLSLQSQLFLHRDAIVNTLRTQNRNAHPMDILATLIRTFGNEVYSLDATEDQESVEKFALSLTFDVGYLAGIMKRWYERRRPLIMPEIYDSVAKNILYQMKGRKPDEFEEHLMDLALILYAEHEFNASTFAVRLAASAHTDIFSAIVCGIGTLRGSRHGGANENAMRIMLEIKNPENVRKYVNRFLKTPGARLPGFGHAVYTQGDPRVPIIKPWVKELSERKRDTRWYEIALALEEYMAERAKEKNRGIPANIDLWTAPLYYLLGIPIPFYTPLFASARIAGWCAHYLEVRHNPKVPILRPRAQYIGPQPRPFLS
ncbi:citrate/2-methylcitrate synthase [Patescibacteria group bacterium AH-259-L05]|nr:citrate/2-methylcitrate synthase [Patescibacteria group bacterium AH-259-L05]